MPALSKHPTFIQAVAAVALLNFSYFFIEFYMGYKIGSVSLFADSIDFLEDSLLNTLIFFAFYWSKPRQKIVARIASISLLIPVFFTAYTIWKKTTIGTVPDPLDMGVTAFGALIVNVSCAFILHLYKKKGNALYLAAFLSARNDALVNISIMVAGVITFYNPSYIPDLVVGVFIAYLNIDAAKKVWNSVK